MKHNEDFSLNLSLSLSLSLFAISLCLSRWTPLGGGWSHSRHQPPPRNASRCTSCSQPHNISITIYVQNPSVIANHFPLSLLSIPNPKTYNTLLGHIISQDGIVVNPEKVKAITKARPPTNANGLSRFLGQIWWHSQMICYLDDVATPFQWTTTEQDAYDSLKQIL